ncbi:tumor protein p53-inducible protein 13 isoform X2 [Tachysurus fulvidraco]|uniref:tumor protein p53-inducible protein 13 isoform X2 n=1 Tax=Tachysurus fulvidraco TaxID=1234273 RepID=UPI001FEFF5B7|nr:tumor protein p53-inducible protein 13 isoform X2 [Tachysurus fulvidraco]
MRLRAQVLMFGLVWLCVNKCHSLLTQHCDTGKANLKMDLFPPDEFLCPSPRPVTPALLLYVSTKYSLQPAVHVCMDLPITYNHTIPNSGPHRPIGAQSGEYLYCPPQRWINNLKDGATVLLFHPCASEDARRGLAAVAHSCLPHFILTAHPHLSQHRPFALVSWGHTLEMSHITRAGVCEWLLTFSSNFNQTASRGQNYNLYLTKAAPVDRVLDTAVKPLKACCLEALSAYAATLRARRSRSVQQPTKRKMKKREIEKEEVKHSENPSVISSKSGTLNPTHTQTLNNSESKDLLSIGHVTASLHTAMHSEERVGDVVDKEAKTSSTQMKSLKEPHGDSRSNVTVVKLHDSQIDVKSEKKNSITVASGKQRIKTDVVQLSAGEGCTDPGHCGPPDVATAVIGGPLRGHKMPIQRTNEAVWAAAALGFLLVLLTLSVLHTRLYRNCRAPSSLYWRESHQDYESVADIIRRRLRMVGRRKRRASQSRRQECPLLSDSSTDDD